MPYTKDNNTFHFHNSEGKLVHSSDSISIVFYATRGIVKHGPTSHINAWANKMRQEGSDCGSIIDSKDWDLKDLNKKIKNTPL